MARIQIPADFEVKPIGPNDPAKDRMTCGTCGLSWDDGIVTGMTPVPSARCPFEYFHLEEEETMKRITDKQVDEAKGILRAAYYQEIKDSAEEIKAECDKGEIADRDALETRIHEECDGSAWIIYTAKTWHLLFVSDNDEAYFEDGGEREGALTEDGLNLQTLGYYAMRRDLWDALEVAGIDSDWDGPEDEDEEEEDEEEAPPTDEERAAVARVLADGAWRTTEAIIQGTGLDADRTITAIVNLEAEGLIHTGFGRQDWAQFLAPVTLDAVCAALETGDGTTGDVERATNLMPSYVEKALRLLELQGRVQRTEATYRLA